MSGGVRNTAISSELNQNIFRLMNARDKKDEIRLSLVGMHKERLKEIKLRESDFFKQEK